MKVFLSLLALALAASAVDIGEIKIVDGDDATMTAVNYLDASYDYTSQKLMFTYTVDDDTDSALTMAEAFLVSSENTEDDAVIPFNYGCVFNFGPGSYICYRNGTESDDMFAVGEESEEVDGALEGSLMFVDAPTLMMQGDWTVRLTGTADGDGGAAPEEDDTVQDVPGFMKCNGWALAETDVTQQCIVNYWGSCPDVLHPAPYMARLGLYSTYTDEWVEFVDLDVADVDEDVDDGALTAVPPSAVAYQFDVRDNPNAPKNLQARLMIKHGVADGVDGEEVEQTDPAILDWQDLKVDFESLDLPGCPNFEAFCNGESDELPPLPAGYQVMDVGSILCSQNGTFKVVEDDPCYSGQIVPMNDANPVMLELGCELSCALGYTNLAPEIEKPKMLQCLTGSIGWEEVEDADVPRGEFPTCTCDDGTGGGGASAIGVSAATFLASVALALKAL